MSEEFPFFRIISFAIEPNNEHIVLNVRDKSDNKLNKNKWTQHRFKSSEVCTPLRCSVLLVSCVGGSLVLVFCHA
jgi:hypothetical protein